MEMNRIARAITRRGDGARDLVCQAPRQQPPATEASRSPLPAVRTVLIAVTSMAALIGNGASNATSLSPRQTAATISAAATPIDAVRNSRIDRPDAVSRLYISQSQSRLDLADGENRLDVTAAEGAKHSAAQPSAIALAVPSLHG